MNSSEFDDMSTEDCKKAFTDKLEEMEKSTTASDSKIKQLANEIKQIAFLNRLINNNLNGAGVKFDPNNSGKMQLLKG